MDNLIPSRWFSLWTRLLVWLRLHRKPPTTFSGGKADHLAVALPQWYRQRSRADGGALSDTTLSSYLKALDSFSQFEKQQRLFWKREPDEVRAQIAQYLRSRFGCSIKLDLVQGGYIVSVPPDSPRNAADVRVFLAALRDFYDLMADISQYVYANPLRLYRSAPSMPSSGLVDSHETHRSPPWRPGMTKFDPYPPSEDFFRVSD